MNFPQAREVHPERRKPAVAGKPPQGPTSSKSNQTNESPPIFLGGLFCLLRP
jgi:hypothetical protein